jgi:hypothetical protein
LTLAALTSLEESCRKRFTDKKKALDELMNGIKSTKSEIKIAAL